MTASPPTLREFVCQHLDVLCPAQPHIIDRYRAVVRNDLPDQLLDTPLADITRDDIAAWVRGLQRRGLKPSSIRHKHRFLSSVFNSAIASGLLPGNPARRVPLPARRAATTPRHLTPEQFTVLDAAMTEHYRPLLRFLAASGCRFGEATALHTGDVDRRAGLVTISKTWKYRPGTGADTYTIGEPKTAASNRVINVDPRVLDTLDYSNTYLFTTKWGNPVRLQNFHTYVWAPTVKRAIATPGSPLRFVPRIHDLRHTCATWMLQAGVPMNVVSQHLGHSKIATTMDIYSHVDRPQMQTAAAVLGEIIAKG